MCLRRVYHVGDSGSRESRADDEAEAQHVDIACTATDGAAARVAAPDELVEVRWLGLDEVDDVMPDLFAPVRECLVQHLAGR